MLGNDGPRGQEILINGYEWIFKQPTNITGISIQGQQLFYVVFVTNYTISFSDDGNNFQGYKEEGAVKVR